MRVNVKNRTITTRLVEREEPFNYRVVAELVARNIMEGVHNDKTRTT